MRVRVSPRRTRCITYSTLGGDQVDILSMSEQAVPFSRGHSQREFRVRSSVTPQLGIQFSGFLAGCRLFRNGLKTNRFLNGYCFIGEGDVDFIQIKTVVRSIIQNRQHGKESGEGSSGFPWKPLVKIPEIIKVIDLLVPDHTCDRIPPRSCKPQEPWPSPRTWSAVP